MTYPLLTSVFRNNSAFLSVLPSGLKVRTCEKRFNVWIKETLNKYYFYEVAVSRRLKDSPANSFKSVLIFKMPRQHGLLEGVQPRRRRFQRDSSRRGALILQSPVQLWSTKDQIPAGSKSKREFIVSFH